MMIMMMMMMMMMRRERTSAKVKLVGGNQPVSAEATGGSSGGSKDQNKHVKAKTSPSLLNPNQSSSVRVGSGD